MDAKLLSRQIALEEEAFKSSLDKYDNYFAKAVENGTITENKEVIIIIKVMIDSLSEYIDEYYKLPLRGRNRDSQQFLMELCPNPRNMAYFLITTILRPLFKGPQKLLSVSRELITSLNNSHRVRALREQAPKLHSYIEKTHEKRGGLKRALMITARKVADFSSKTSLAIGTNCIDLILNSGCNLIVITNEGSTNVVGLSEQTKELILRSKFFFGNMMTMYYPMVCEPKEIDSLVGSGGYYTLDSVKFIKFRSNADFRSVEARDNDLTRLYDVVNNISKTPYRINTRMLNIINTIIKHRLINSKSSPINPVLYGDIPYMDTMIANEIVPKSAYGVVNSDGRFANFEDKKKWLKALQEQEDRIQAIESKRLQYRLALQVAEKFKSYDKIYFTYQVDFRSRLYPLQQYLNPQTSSNLKPLLEFAEGCVLSESGLYWLKVHGANCYGYDKLSYSDRVRLIEEMEEDILRIARDPIGNIKLWFEVDEPLQFVDFCLSYNDYYIDHNAIIRLPIALDATCSGLQIYSGLLRDASGGSCVNVLPSKRETPADIYADVATKVNSYLLKGDYEKTITYTTKDKVVHTDSCIQEATSVAGKIDRKITKRNVMTQPYSVTTRGMYSQLYDLLTDYENNQKKFWVGEKFILASLLTELNARAIADTVKGASIGQKLIKGVLRKALNKSDEAYWLTPIFKFPVLQRIYTEKKERLRTPLGRLVLYHQTDKVHYTRMLNGIAPNFIHSLDAVLLYRTVELCQERGITAFWLIHDSYAVKANDIEILNECFREAYIELFTLNPLQQWVNQILPESSNIVSKVMVNTLDLQEVRNSKYIIC